MIVIEANEIPPEVFEWYSKLSTGIISKAIIKQQLSSTLIDDVDEDELYPSQAWASVSTGNNAKNIRYVGIMTLIQILPFIGEN